MNQGGMDDPTEKRSRPAFDPGVEVPRDFSATMARAEQMAAEGKSPVGASIMPEDIDLPPDPDDSDTRDIPIERMAKDGKEVVINEAGEPSFGKPAEGAHYELLDMLGRGGMGVVVAARQQSLKREVALKIARKVAVDKNTTTGGLIEQFANEAFITASMDHPNVVPVHSLAKDINGHLFFTMKRVTGIEWENLLNPRYIKIPSERIKAKRQAEKMTFDDHLEVLLKVADAVAYAHSKQILHRDLKPENVMIGAFGEVLLMDWGLAMGFGEKNPYRLDPKKKPQLVGTPGYLAPEMATGKMKEFCPATDVYQLGGILYRLLTGRSPHHADKVMAAVHHAAKGEVTPPEEASGNPEINSEISRIAMKALSPRISDRYSTVAEFQDELRRYRNNAKSMAVSADADSMLDELIGELGDGTVAHPRAKGLRKNRAAVAYTNLSECIGAFGQAIKLWPGNRAARSGRLQAISLQIKLALQQGDLTVARAHLEMLQSIGEKDVDDEWARKVRDRYKKFATRLDVLSKKQAEQGRKETIFRVLLIAFLVLVVTGIAGGFYLITKQKDLALDNLKTAERARNLMQENLRLSEQMQKKMFAQAVLSRAALVAQYMRDVEQIVSQYRAEAVRMMTLPESHLPRRDRTAAGRDGFFLDEDYYQASTAPGDVAPDDRYGFAVSKSQVTTVLAPWARTGAARTQALLDAGRLTRLNVLFSQVAGARSDILWSLAGSLSGVLASFPGSGRFREKPDYDPTKRPWFLGAVDALDDKPRWMNPHVDAGGQGLIIACTSRIHAGGRTLGVVGLELSLRTLQDMLSQFTRSAGSGARGLLVRPDGKVIVDTLYEAGSTRWKEKFDLEPIESVGKQLASYYQGAVDGSVDKTTALEIETPQGKKLLAHARLSHPDWILIVQTDLGAVVKAGP